MARRLWFAEIGGVNLPRLHTLTSLSLYISSLDHRNLHESFVIGDSPGISLLSFFLGVVTSNQVSKWKTCFLLWGVIRWFENKVVLFEKCKECGELSIPPPKRGYLAK